VNVTVLRPDIVAHATNLLVVHAEDQLGTIYIVNVVDQESVLHTDIVLIISFQIHVCSVELLPAVGVANHKIFVILCSH
jgi:hypothetical protein